MRRETIARYLTFEEFPHTAKTKRFAIKSNTGDLIGHVQWSGEWKQYCFYPSSPTIWDRRCLNEVIEFINLLMEERIQRNEKQTNQHGRN